MPDSHRDFDELDFHEVDFDEVDFYNELSELFPSKYFAGKRRRLIDAVGSEKAKRARLESAFSALKENAGWSQKSPASSPTSEHGSSLTTVDATTQTSARDSLQDLITNRLATIFEELHEYESEDDSQIGEEASDSSAPESGAVLSKLKEFRDLLGGGESLSTTRYFRDIMTDAERDKALEQARVVSKSKQKCQSELIPLTYQILVMKLPDKYKLLLLEKARLLEELDPTTVEHYKLATWLSNITRVPFGTFKSNPVTLLNDDLSKCQAFLEKGHEQLNRVTHGMEEAKLQIMQLLCQWVSNPNAAGTSIALHGPMGTGKTTIVKEGISRILGRDFVFIPLGGATDSSFLEGHSYTYEGSTFGKIVQALRDCGSMNPVFFFDELDKVSNTPKGDEIIGVLTHLTDSSQNNAFYDRYYSELSFDLSKALYFFSYNDATKVNPILLDRMHKIRIKGYGTMDKIEIAKKHLIPEALNDFGFSYEQLIFSDTSIKEIIEKFTSEEKGVRNLKRCIGNLIARLNMIRLMNKPQFKCMKGIEIKFPLSIDSDLVDKLLSKPKEDESWRSLYI